MFANGQSTKVRAEDGTRRAAASFPPPTARPLPPTPRGPPPAPGRAGVGAGARPGLTGGGPRSRVQEGEKFRSTLNSLAYGNAMEAAARDYKKVRGPPPPPPPRSPGD